MLALNRVFYKQGSTLTDLTAAMSDVLAETAVVPLVASGGAIYLASDMPFNHRFIKVKAPNANASIARVSLWNGGSWLPAVDVIDQTSVGGKTLAQDGIISWVPERNIAWARMWSSEQIPELSTLKIYDLYWAKIEFSGDFSALTELGYVGHRFCRDTDLAAEYPDLMQPELMTAFAAGKTDWVDQEVIASEYVIDELRERNIAWTANQILDWTTFKHATVHKTAAVIMNSFGAPYFDRKARAEKEYRETLRADHLDRNLDARLDDTEKEDGTRFMTR